MLRRIGYTVGHDGELRIPIWVSYHLTDKYVNGKKFISRSRLKWTADPDLSPDKRSTNEDYLHSGYSRGHMAMQSDLRGRNKLCERQGYLMSNIAPQLQGLNAGVWLDLEYQCKKWAQNYNEIWIVCGPIVSDKSKKLNGKLPGRVTIPDKFYKIVVRLDNNVPVALAFIMPHEPFAAKGTPLATFLVSIDDVEQATGLDFFSKLDDKIEKTLEASLPAEIW
jgi:endonuclease G